MKIVKFFIFTAIGVFVACLLWLVFLLDISQKELDVVANPDITKAEPGRAPVYLVSYVDGDEIYFRNQNALAMSALGRGVDHILNYRRSLLDPEFVKRNAQILNTPHGAGLWMWKPWVILDAMKKAPEGAIIIYADSGFIFQRTITRLLKKFNKKDILVSYYDQPEYGPVETRVQRSTLELMGVYDDLAFRKKNFMMAGFLIVRNNEKGRAFIKKWLKHCSDPRKIMDTPIKGKPESDKFQGHHYDQAILTILAHLEHQDIAFIPYDEVLKTITWHHRSNRDIKKDKSVAPYLGGVYRKRIDALFSNLTLTFKIGKEIFTNGRPINDLVYALFNKD